MPFADTQQFIRYLETQNDLIRIIDEVDSYLEAAAIIDLVCKSESQNQALLFENVRGAELFLVANLFGSSSRTAAALGVENFQQLSKHLHEGLVAHKKLNSDDALNHLVCSKAKTTLVESSAPCFENDLTTKGLDVLPALHSWRGDGGKYLTLAQVVTIDPDNAMQNCGMYRVQLVGRHKALLRCHPTAGASKHLDAWRLHGQDMPVAIVLGGPPALTWCSGISLPDDVDEVKFVEYLSGASLPQTRSLEFDLLVPSHAELIIEGTVSINETMLEGPFGNHTGYYSPAAPAPVINITRISARHDAIYPCTIVGKPPMENVFLAQAAACVMLPLLQHDHPWVTNVHMLKEGIYHRAAVISMNADQLMIEEVAEELWASRMLRNSRLLVLVNEEVNIHSASEVFWRVVNADEWEKSVYITEGKMVVDARTISNRSRVDQDERIKKKAKRILHELR